jgi:hypothetical protein
MLQASENASHTGFFIIEHNVDGTLAQNRMGFKHEPTRRLVAPGS